MRDTALYLKLVHRPQIDWLEKSYNVAVSVDMTKQAERSGLKDGLFKGVLEIPLKGGLESVGRL